jgi:A/G-specific adenine glycosylase
MINNSLSINEINEFQQILLSWFYTHQRHFPWRETLDPFHILIAEKLLQKTHVSDKLIRAYGLIIEKYPTSKLLANADVNDLITIMAALGLHYRAKELIQLANAIENEYFGVIPKDYKLILQLPGVGEYSARAILSFAFGLDIAIVDTNVARFLFRVFGIDMPIPANPARKKLLIDLASTLLPIGKARDFNLAILDLTAALCKIQNPECNSCPIRTLCFYFDRVQKQDD